MASVNKVIVLGNLGRDPETRYTPDGASVTTVSIATTSSWKDKNTGEKREETEWHRVVFFGRIAEIASEYLRKGSACYVEGRLKTRKWTDKDGVEKYSTEIVADQIQLLARRAMTVASAARTHGHQSQLVKRGRSRRQREAGANTAVDDGDDIPFRALGRRNHDL